MIRLILTIIFIGLVISVLLTLFKVIAFLIFMPIREIIAPLILMSCEVLGYQNSAAYRLVKWFCKWDPFELDGPTPAERARRESEQRRESYTTKVEPNPFEILGISRKATKTEIVEAYREKIKKNHPDHVAHLDLEIQKLVVERAKQINVAYKTALCTSS